MAEQCKCKNSAYVCINKDFLQQIYADLKERKHTWPIFIYPAAVQNILFSFDVAEKGKMGFFWKSIGAVSVLDAERTTINVKKKKESRGLVISRC